MRVTHASVGATDVMAVRGDYLLQPFPRFVPGYDFIGTIEHLPEEVGLGLSAGQRVAGILPRMGTHANVMSIAPSLLVPVPDGLDSATAATVPLDAITAQFALDALALDSGSVLVQGAGGAVGAWAVQLSAVQGLNVYGTASPRSRPYAERLGAEVFDYRDPAWVEHLFEASAGGIAGAIDHTGSRALRRVVRPNGRIVRIAFGGEPGAQPRTTAAGFLTSAMRRYAQPGERICSVPSLVVTRRGRYRQALAALLGAVAKGTLVTPRPLAFSFAEYADALAHATGSEPGAKVILTMPDR